MIPTQGAPGDVQRRDLPALECVPDNGNLVIPVHPISEQEYALTLEFEQQTVAEFRLYALDEDLFSRRPYKGDFHMHTYYSDGKESPAYVAGCCRRIGLDFMAITDHHRYAPSLEAIQAYAEAPIDLRIYPGEEVHPPDNRVHILNFGGSFSVNEKFADDAYPSEVAAIAAALDLDEGMDRYPYASCVWCYDQIRQGGGLGVFCHPYWLHNRRYDVPVTLTDLLFERQPFDALELIGGYFRHEMESNTLQVARYQEERAQGKRIPIVGVSDAHGCERGELFGWFYTIAFSPTLDLPDLVTNIKALYSVAVEALPGETARAYGPFRLVRYAQFLLREIFPLHDALCVEEGRQMLEYASGAPQAAAALAALRGRTQKLYDHLWDTSG